MSAAHPNARFTAPASQCPVMSPEWQNPHVRIGRYPVAQLPRIYLVNWFRKSAGRDFLWPRVLKWIFERCEGTAKAVETPIGRLSAEGELDLAGLDVSEEDLAELLHVDAEGWLADVLGMREYYEQFGSRMPPELRAELEALEQRLKSSAD